MRGRRQCAALSTAVLFAVAVAACTSDSAEPSPKEWETAAETPKPSVPPTTDEPRPTAPQTAPSPTDESTVTSSPPSSPDVVPGKHETGVCLDDDPNHIIGTPGDDTLRGTAADENICGMGGDDVIIGGGGEDSIWGGPGDDNIEGGPNTDFLYGNDGDDVLRGNNANPEADFLYGDSVGSKFDDAGDDVLLGGTVSGSDNMYGGVGGDLLIPTPHASAVSPGGNSVDAGPGNDVVVTLDFSVGVFVDHVDLDGEQDLTIPLGGTGCKVTAQLDLAGDTTPQAKEGAVSCTLPWPRRVSGLDKVLPVSASVDQDGEVSMDMTLYNELGKLSVSAYRDLVKAQASLGGDVCVCDPLNASPSRQELLLPRDFPA